MSYEPWKIDTPLPNGEDRRHQLHGHQFTVAARIYAVQEANNCYWNAANRFELREKLPDGFLIICRRCWRWVRGLNLPES